MYQLKKNVVKKLMIDKDLSTTELCKLLSITRPTFYSMMNNNHSIRIDTALDLAKLLDTSIYEIYKEI